MANMVFFLILALNVAALARGEEFSEEPTRRPTGHPTSNMLESERDPRSPLNETDYPSTSPSQRPTDIPSTAPSQTPSSGLSFSPSSVPSQTSSDIPSTAPSQTPSSGPSFVPSSISRDFIPRCGECWCIFGDPDEGATCPAFGLGIHDSFPEAIHQHYASFNLVASDDNPKLESADGGECFPYTHLGSIDDFPESAYPQCVDHAKSDVTGAVCGFRYPDGPVDDVESCMGRSYEMKSYDSSEAATSAGAVVTHDGACGVCSSAVDLAAMMESVFTMEDKSLQCSIVYYLNVKTLSEDPAEEFRKMVECFQGIGYTKDCATMWAHSSATVVNKCLDECVGALSGSNVNNGDPPDCELSLCLQCTNEKQGQEFDKFVGRTNVNSGITNTIATPCENFSRITYQPCDGLLAGTTNPPTKSPTTSAAHAHRMSWASGIVSSTSVMIGIIFLA